MKNINFAKNLLFLKDKKGLSLNEMLTDIGFKRTTWSGYVNEKSFPTVADLLKIAEYFDIDLESLMRKNLSEGGDYPKKKVHKMYTHGGDSGGFSGGFSLKTEPQSTYNGPVSTFPPNELVRGAIVNMLLEDKAATIKALNESVSALKESVSALKDHNATLNALIQEMGKDVAVQAKRSAAG